jgi:hypothetical protein
MPLRIKRRGNCLSLIIPKGMAVIASTMPAKKRTILRLRSKSIEGYGMGVKDNDEILAAKTPLGYKISAYDSSFTKKIEAARKGMRKYRNALVELAK